jgi:hypothetical protein
MKLHVRIFLSSPADVSEERQLARRILQTLASDPLLRKAVSIEVVSWDDLTAGAPMFANLSPQDAINHGLAKPQECDLTVVILWSRVGVEPGLTKPNGEAYLSGTEWEYLNALQAGRPVLIYRSLIPVHVDLDETDLEEKRRQRDLVKQFFERMRTVGGGQASYTSYKSLQEFATVLERDVKTFLGTIITQQPFVKALSQVAVALPEIPVAYREWLKRTNSTIELLGLRLKHAQSVRLKQVYVPLLTPADDIHPPTTDEFTSFRGERLLIDRLGRSSALISGVAGSGKSTFCRWLAWSIAQGYIPEPDDERESALVERLPGTLAGRLPVIVRLKDLWAQTSSRVGNRSATRADVEAGLASWLRDSPPPGLSWDLLAAHLNGGNVFLLFDGLDEVPSSSDNESLSGRAALIGALSKAFPVWLEHGNRVLVTSRPFVLDDQGIRDLGLPSVRILGLDRLTRDLLVNKWFTILNDDLDEGGRVASAMLAQLGALPSIERLISNPLLLTAICIVYSEGKRLPQDLYELYDRMVDTVLHNRLSDPMRVELIRSRLRALAYGMHTSVSDNTSLTSRATYPEIDAILASYQEESAWSESGFRTVLESREELLTLTGLLIPDGYRRGAFFHFSIQEFLAAERMADIERDNLSATIQDRSRSPEWRNTLVFALGAVLANSSSPDRAVRLLRELILRLTPDEPGLVLVVIEALKVLRGRGITLDTALHDKYRQAAVATLRGAQDPLLRARVGVQIAAEGDPRFAGRFGYLFDDSMLGFVQIAAANTRRFFLARYPTTVAQFQAFVSDTGFTLGDLRALSGLSNHPVVLVSWYEAVEYTRWLNRKLREWGDLPNPLNELLEAGVAASNPWMVALPSEAEWQSAASGGCDVPYPWGDTIDPNLANYDKTKIIGTSTVGCFPNGASPFGVEEMSGNVWEWTRSQYRPEPSRAAVSPPEVADFRVVRGGAYYNSEFDVCIAKPYADNPKVRLNGFGFRVALCQADVV